jgi:RNA polymerase sigma-70 factor (ECF subfamily)
VTTATVFYTVDDTEHGRSQGPERRARVRPALAVVPKGEPADDDVRLMARIGRGDAAACATLVDRHLGGMVAFAGRVLGDAAEAEDVAQEVFERVWTSASRWEPRAKLSTWLHRVAMNLCLDRIARRREQSLDDVPEPLDPKPSPYSEAAARDLGRHVQAALLTLPERQRIAITLCHHQGLSGYEAAEILGVGERALESLLARGRRAMRERLRQVAADLAEERR